MRYLTESSEMAIARSFKAYDVVGYMAAFERDGFVVIEDVLDQDALRNAVDEVDLCLVRRLNCLLGPEH